MKIIIYSHPPYTGTGFGTVTKNLIKHLCKQHEVFVVPVGGYQGVPQKFPDYTMLTCPGPVATSAQWAIKWAQRLCADVIIQHFDAWMLQAGWIHEAPCKVITYAPVDCDPLPDNFAESCSGAFMNVAMSRHAEKLLRSAGMPTTYIPHGVDTELFQRVSDARQQMGLPPNAFIVGVVATNGSTRKNLGGQMEAFASFAADKNDVLLYMHTQMKKTIPEAIDLQYLAHKLGIEDKVIFSDPDSYAMGMPDEVMPIIYSSFDVLLQCSLGEGFGLPIIEAQACGVPVIGSNCSATRELVDTTVSTTALFMPYYMSNVGVPSKKVMIDKLNVFYEHRHEDASVLMRKKAVGYEWKEIFPLWDKLLSSCC